MISLFDYGIDIKKFKLNIVDLIVVNNIHY